MNHPKLSLLKQAILNEDVKELQSIIKSDPDICTKQNQDDYTPIRTAIFANKLKTLKVLLNFCSALTLETDIHGNIPAHTAVLSKNLEALEIILEANLKCITEKNKYGETPAHTAVICNQLKALEILLNIHPELALEKDQHGNTLLHKAVVLGHQEIVNFLLSTCDLGITEIINNCGQKPIDLIDIPSGLPDDALNDRRLNNDKIKEQLQDAANIHRIVNLDIKDDVNTVTKIEEVKDIELLISKACKLFSTQPIVFNDASKEHKYKAQIIKQVSDNIELTNEQLSQLKTALDGTQLQLIYNDGLPTLKELAALSPFVNSFKILLDETKNDDQKVQELWDIVDSQAVFIDTKDRKELVVKYPHIFNEIHVFNPEIAAEFLRVMTCTEEQMLADQENDSDSQEATNTEVAASSSYPAHSTDSCDISALGEAHSMETVND